MPKKTEFVKLSYLPQGNTVLAVSAVKIHGVTVISPPEIPVLPIGLRRHSDLGICVFNTLAVCPPDTFDYYNAALSPFGFKVICANTPLGGNYPHDTAYNVGIAGNNCFVNTQICDRVLFNLLLECGYKIIDVKQGYAKCSICPIDENTIICGDKGICLAAEKNGIDALEITNDGILLKGYQNGFFGGAAGMLSPNLLAVNGELDYIADGQKIKDFLDERKIKVLNLKKGEICDIGSVIPLMIDVHNI